MNNFQNIPNLNNMQNFEYYHGTSTVFLNSIKRTGLGGINPNIEYKTLDLLKFLAIEAKKNIPDNLYYRNNHTSINAMANQQPVILETPSGRKQKFHYRHDNIFIALSLQRAVVYATINKYGSEILQTCINLYQELTVSNPEFTIPKELNAISIEQLTKLEPEPIIIKISNIKDEDLAKEDGKTAKEALDLLRFTIIPLLSDKELFEFIQDCNFELLKPVSVENLQFFKVKTQGHPKDKNFKFNLVEF